MATDRQIEDLKTSFLLTYDTNRTNRSEEETKAMLQLLININLQAEKICGSWQNMQCLGPIWEMTWDAAKAFQKGLNK